MEELLNPSVDPRLAALELWLQSLIPAHRLDLTTLRVASSDASFRRYFRLQRGDKTVIVMDAPPTQEDCRPFLHVTGLLARAGLRVPAILAQDLDQGFLLMSDLGNQTYYEAIQAGMDDVPLQKLYRSAIGALVDLQQADVTGLAPYDVTRLLNELNVLPDWYARHHCQVELDETERAVLHKAFAILVNDNVKQPRVLVHRDFHSPNLMIGPECSASEGAPAGLTTPGIIDYQDALHGPLTYDVASLVMDARTTWEEPQQLEWTIRYWEAARGAGIPVPADFADFHRAYEWMGLQRNLRILGVFARLSYRDNKHHYLDHLPRVSAYVRQVAGRYGEFRALLRLLDKLDNRQVVSGYTF
jgi:aminoglycoside/choline kinase family phosphotransferase